MVSLSGQKFAELEGRLKAQQDILGWLLASSQKPKERDARLIQMLDTEPMPTENFPQDDIRFIYLAGFHREIKQIVKIMETIITHNQKLIESRKREVITGIYVPLWEIDLEEQSDLNETSVDELIERLGDRLKS